MLKEADLDAALAVIEKQDTIANITKNIFIEFHKTNIFNFFMVVNTQ